MKKIAGFSPSLHVMSILLVVLIIFVPSVQAQRTTITNLQYPRQAVGQVTITFAVGYLDVGGASLAFGIRDCATSNWVKGSGASTPDSCQSTAGTQYTDSALCWTKPPPTSSGTEHASFSLTFDTTQEYALRVEAWMYGPSGNAVTGSQSYWDFKISVTAQTVSTSQTVSSISVTTLLTSTTVATKSVASQSITSTTSEATAALGIGGVPSNLLLLAAVIAVIVIVGVVFLMRRHASGSKMQEITAPAEPSRGPPPRIEAPKVTEAPPAPRPASARGFKHCIHCGATIPAVVVFCTKCGKKQE